MAERDSDIKLSSSSSCLKELKYPGIYFEKPEGLFNVLLDEELLFLRIELKVGENTVKSIDFTEDCMGAYVELVNTEDIDKILKSNFPLHKGEKPLKKKLVDLIDIKIYLIVRNIEDWMKDMIKDHFEMEANGAPIKSVQFLQSGTAVIKFVNPKDALNFQSISESKFVAGYILNIEVAREISDSEIMEESVLSVTNLPVLFSQLQQQKCLEKYFLKLVGKHPSTCTVINNFGYLTFADSRDVHSIASNPSMPPIYRDTYLKLSVISKSEYEKIQLQANEGSLSNFPAENYSAIQNYDPIVSSSASSMIHPSVGSVASTLELKTTSSFDSQLSQMEDTADEVFCAVETIVLIENELTKSSSYLESLLSNIMKTTCTVKQYEDKFIATFKKQIDFEMLQNRVVEKAPHYKLHKLDNSKTMLVSNLRENVVDNYLKLHLEQYTGKGSIATVKMMPNKQALVTFYEGCSLKTAIGSHKCWELDETIIELTEYYDFMSPQKFLENNDTKFSGNDSESPVQEKKSFPKSHIKALSHFSIQNLDAVGVESYSLDESCETITVQADYDIRKKFYDIIEKEIKNICEERLTLTEEQLYFLQTVKGSSKLQEITGQASVIYTFEETIDDFIIVLLGFSCTDPSGDIKEKLKVLADQVIDLTTVHSIKLNSQKVHICRSDPWKMMAEKVEEDCPVVILVNEDILEIHVIGEKKIAEEVLLKINSFLCEKCSQEYVIKMKYPMWVVIKSNFQSDLDKIKQKFSEDLKIIWPNSSDECKTKEMIVTLKGDPSTLKEAKQEISELQNKVCFQEGKLSQIHAAADVLSSMQEKIDLLELRKKVSIDVDLFDDDLTLKESDRMTSLQPQKVGAFKLKNEARINVYTGNFTFHKPVDIVTVFVQVNPDYSGANLERLFCTEKGHVLREYFQSKMSTLPSINPGYITASDVVGQIKCNKIVYCFLTCWSTNNKDAEYLLKHAVEKVLQLEQDTNTFVFSSACSQPLNYPAQVFSKALIEGLSSPHITSEFSASVYIDDNAVQNFIDVFMDPKYGCKTPDSSIPPKTAKERVKAIKSSIDKYIKLLKGSLLDQEADVYVNSTNSNLDLKTGSLSKKLLEKCGQQLQEECSKYSPLKTGDIAVTGATGLRCKSIYHVAIPQYYSHFHARRKLRETIQKVLQLAVDNGVKSIGFPSLGVGNLKFPASVSAEEIYSEIIEFKYQHPDSDIQFVIAIFDQDTFQEFSKVHANNICGPSVEKKETLKLTVQNGDIADQECDIIVNTTNENMDLTTSPVSIALLNRAGQDLQNACHDLVHKQGLKLRSGKVVKTNSFGELKCKKVYHAHIPAKADFLKNKQDHHPVIYDTVQKCLKMAEAERDKCKSISFPAFGYGKGGFRADEVARPMLESIRDFGNKNPDVLESARIVIKDKELYKEFSDFFRKFFEVGRSNSKAFATPLTAVLTNSKENKTVELKYSPYSTLSTSDCATDSKTSTITFGVFAASDEICTEVLGDLRQATVEKCVCDKIEHSSIEKIVYTDREDIRMIEREYQVKIEILKGINKISIEGEKRYVMEAKTKVLKYLSTIKDIRHQLEIFEWYTHVKDDEIEKYSEDDSYEIEKAYFNHLELIELTIDHIKKIIDFKKMEERCVSTGNVRKVMRERRQFLNCPKTWVEMDPKSKQYLFDVPQNSDEYKNVYSEIVKTKGTLIVVVKKIERIQNRADYERHITFKRKLCQKYNEQNINTKRLFHGCKQSVIDSIIASGFNRSFATSSNAANYGNGVYFALNFSYSAQPRYASPNSDGEQFILFSSVLIGRYTRGARNMKVPPFLEEGSSERYDTLVERVESPTIFVAFEDAQAYPEYLITFTIKK